MTLTKWKKFTSFSDWPQHVNVVLQNNLQERPKPKLWTQFWGRPSNPPSTQQQHRCQHLVPWPEAAPLARALLGDGSPPEHMGPERSWERAAPSCSCPNVLRACLWELYTLFDYPFTPLSFFLTAVKDTFIGDFGGKMHKYRTVFAIWTFLFHLPFWCIKFIQPRC